MADYLRCRIPGGAYFFTVVTADRRPILIDRIHNLRSAFRQTAARHPFRMEAAVVLPDHLHCIWTLPPGDADFSVRWMLIKAKFSRLLVQTQAAALRRHRRGERSIWQPRFWEHLIRDERDLGRHIDYVHYNPVKHAYVPSAADWPHSSFQRFVERGVYTPDWGRDVAEDPGLDYE